MGTCAQCGRIAYVTPSGLCFDVGADGGRVLGTGCEGLADVAERARIDGLAVAMGCAPDEVDARTLTIAAEVLALQWHEVTADKITPQQAAVRAAVAKGKP